MCVCDTIVFPRQWKLDLRARLDEPGLGFLGLFFNGLEQNGEIGGKISTLPITPFSSSKFPYSRPTGKTYKGKNVASYCSSNNLGRKAICNPILSPSTNAAAPNKFVLYHARSGSSMMWWGCKASYVSLIDLFGIDPSLVNTCSRRQRRHAGWYKWR